MKVSSVRTELVDRTSPAPTSHTIMSSVSVVIRSNYLEDDSVIPFCIKLSNEGFPVGDGCTTCNTEFETMGIEVQRLGQQSACLRTDN